MVLYCIQAHKEVNLQSHIMLSATELRKGVVFKNEGKTWIVLKYEFNKTGRGAGTVKIKAKDIINQAIVEKGFNLNQKFEEASVERKSAQYLYADEDNGYFMDNESFEQYTIAAENVEDVKKYIIEGGKVVLMYLDEIPISAELPKSVNLKVEYTEPAVKGDTSNNPMKMAQLETGLQIQVPMFVKNGDIVKVSTETGEYSERVNA